MNTPRFPTALHQASAQVVQNFFKGSPHVDTVLVVNSCARGQGVPESDLDFAILVKPTTPQSESDLLQTEWQEFSLTEPTLLRFSESTPYCKVHLDIITGKYEALEMEDGGAPDYFEVEIGNQVCYAAPMGNAGPYFLELRERWLSYYDEDLRLARLAMTRHACEFDLGHISLYLERGLYFYAFDRLYVAFQKYLQALFIAHKTYPIAYNKWIREQVVQILNLPELYPMLVRILSVSDIASDEIGEKGKMLHSLLNDLR